MTDPIIIIIIPSRLIPSCKGGATLPNKGYPDQGLLYQSMGLKPTWRDHDVVTS
jgi:hypothetical protein